jgi:6-pyruvoyltetrahydropterin/6-carboxytetrahydropterin synthase
MVLLSRKTGFSAAHRYYLPHLSEEENRRRFGACAYPYGHGHDYRVEVTVAGDPDPRTGMVVNITDLKPVLQSEVVEPLEGEYLTPEHPLLAGRIPATEVLAPLLWRRLEAALAAGRLPARLERVDVAESARLRATCERRRPGRINPAMPVAGMPLEGEAFVTTLTRTYEFAAAHRLHSGSLSDEENRQIFGKCNNTHGHGHNYLLEVTVGGEPDPETGLLIDLSCLDRVVNTEVIDRYDHRHLNFEIDELRNINPTSENVVRAIWERLAPSLPTLRRVTLRETERNIFSFEGNAGREGDGE